MTTQTCAAIIVTGGKNTRMGGRLKAFLDLNGSTFMDRMLAVIQPRCAEILFAAKDSGPYARWPGIPTVQDQFDIQSPLAGIHAGRHVDDQSGVQCGVVHGVECQRRRVGFQPIQ